MAWEQPAFRVGQLVANATMASNQYKFVKVHTTNNQFALCNVDGEKPLGVLQDNPASGVAGDITVTGITKVTAAEALSAGDHVGTDENGLARVINIGVTAQDLGMVAVGQVLEGAAVNELATIIIGQPLKVEEA